MFKKLRSRAISSVSDKKLAKEFFARQFSHKYSVLGAYIMLQYMAKQRESSNGVDIPDFLLEQQAHEYSGMKIEEYMADGTFEQRYEIAYAEVGSKLPQEYNGLTAEP